MSKVSIESLEQGEKDANMLIEEYKALERHLLRQMAPMEVKLADVRKRIRKMLRNRVVLRKALKVLRAGGELT